MKGGTQTLHPGHIPVIHDESVSVGTSPLVNRSSALAIATKGVGPKSASAAAATQSAVVTQEEAWSLLLQLERAFAPGRVLQDGPLAASVAGSLHSSAPTPECRRIFSLPQTHLHRPLSSQPLFGGGDTAERLRDRAHNPPTLPASLWETSPERADQVLSS